MNTPIIINFTSTIEKFSFSREQTEELIDYTLKQVAATFAARLENEAHVLNTTRADYIRSIYVEDVNKQLKVVGLRGWLANAVEQGCEPFDEKEGFKKSSKIKMKRDGGWYLTIPFRMASSGAVGTSQVFSGKIPKEVEAVVKSKVSKGDLSGVKKIELPSEYAALGKRPVVKSSTTEFNEYVHKSPIYEGTTKSTKPQHGQYINFRRISDLSDPMSWIHTGIQARNLAQKALNKTIPDIRNIMNNAVENILG